MGKQTLGDRLYEAALSAWADWLHTFVAGPAARSSGAVSAILRQSHAMEMRQTTPGVYSNPTLGYVLAEERAWWSAAASIDAIVMDLPKNERIVVLGQAMGYSQATIGQAIGLSQQDVSKLAIKAKASVIPRLMLTANVVRLMAKLHGIDLPAPGLAKMPGPCAA